MKNSSWNGVNLSFLCIPQSQNSCSIGGNRGMCLWSPESWDYIRHPGFFFFFWHIHSLLFLWVTLPPHPVLSQLCWKLQRGQKGNKDPGKIPRILQSPCYFTHLKIVPHTGIAKETLLGLPSNGVHDPEFSKGSPIFHYLKSSSFSFASLSSSLWPESILIYK